MGEITDSAFGVLPNGWDWKNPDYRLIMQQRYVRLDFLRERKSRLQAAKEFYAADHYIEFIRDWGMMRDPRLAAKNLPTVFPFVPWPRQEELLRWIHGLVLAPAKGQMGRGNVDKTRDCGFSWCCVAYACWRFLFFSNNDIGFGSNLERNVFDNENPKAIFTKVNAFLDLLPEEFKPLGWNINKHITKGTSAGKALNPENGSTITGDCGTEIGRGGRTLVYFVDEHASIERPMLAEAALSENTNTQINGSTHKGTGTLFYKQCMSLRAAAPERLFEFDWFADPRKDQHWYETKKSDPMTDAVVFAQEVERDPSASVADGFIPIHLFEEAENNDFATPSGGWRLSLDVAEMGNDNSVLVPRRGDVIPTIKKYRKAEARFLAAEIERYMVKLLEAGDAPIECLIYELAGPGYEIHAHLKMGPFAKVLRPLRPQSRIPGFEFYNVRAQCWGLWKEWLEEGGKRIPKDRRLRELGSALRYSYKTDSKNRKLLIMEDKRKFKGRMSPDPRNWALGPSPDEADAMALNFAPVTKSRFTLEDYRIAANADLGEITQGSSWQSLDPFVGY